MVFTTGRFMLSLALLFVLVFFSPFSIVITSLGEKRAGLCAYRAFVLYLEHILDTFGHFTGVIRIGACKK